MSMKNSIMKQGIFCVLLDIDFHLNNAHGLETINGTIRTRAIFGPILLMNYNLEGSS